MKKKIKLFHIMIFFIVCFSACKSNDKKMTLEERKIIGNCIEYIKNNNNHSFKNEFVVEPYYCQFLISNFFDNSSEKFVKLFREKSIRDYKQLEENINREYADKFNMDLLEFSEADSANYVISFSGFGNGIIMAYVNYNSNLISKSTKKEDYKTDSNYLEYFIFLLDEEGDLKEVVKTAVTIG